MTLDDFIGELATLDCNWRVGDSGAIRDDEDRCPIIAACGAREPKLRFSNMAAKLHGQDILRLNHWDTAHIIFAADTLNPIEGSHGETTRKRMLTACGL